MLASMKTRNAVLILGLGALLLVGCAPSTPPTDSNPAAVTETPAPPTATSVPLAALVNGDPITLEAFERQVARFEQAKGGSGTDLASYDNYQERILDAMIDLVLLAQDARANGTEISEEAIDARVEAIAAEAGGQEELNAWLEANGYTAEQFRQDLKTEWLAAETTARILKELPETEEQVHARQVLLASKEDAEWLLGQLQSGQDFDEMARLYSIDPSTAPAGGDLGWIPKGVLPWPEIDEVLFTLEPGKLSAIVETEIGYHILQVVERDERKLSFQALEMRREQAVQSWLQDRRSASDIQVFITP